MNNLHDRVSKRIRTSIAAAMAIVACGCGYFDYETRLNESRKYYAYLDKIEQSLAPKWTAPGNVMELRVPKQFVMIPAPYPIKRDDGELEMPAVDQRQPDYISLTFPGLYGAWQASFRVNKPDGSTEEDCKGHIYALSNYQQLAGENAVDAGSFVEALKTLLTETLKTPPTDERVEIHPKVVPAYQTQLSYEACTFKGKPIEGVIYTFDVYSRTQGSVICALVIVLPEGMESPQKVSERIPMMLESFSFTRNPPKVGTEVKANPGAPAQQNTTPAGF